MVLENLNTGNKINMSPKAFTKLVKLGVWWEKEFTFVTWITSERYQQHETDFLKRVGFL